MMKKIIYLAIAASAFLTLSNRSSAQHGVSIEIPEPAGKTFSLFYVEGTSPGLSEKLKSILSEKLELNGDAPFLLYVSNSNVEEERRSDYYTKSKSGIPKRISKLDDESLPRPDINSDKKFLWNVMSREDMSVYSQVELHMFFTTEFMYDFFLKESASCQMLNFLPKELSLVAKNSPVTVNVYVSEADPKKAESLRKTLKERVLFKNDGMFETKGLTCNIVVI